MAEYDEDDTYYDEDEISPCEDCEYPCDGWESKFCCRLCHFLGVGNCDNCDPMDL